MRNCVDGLVEELSQGLKGTSGVKFLRCESCRLARLSRTHGSRCLLPLRPRLLPCRPFCLADTCYFGASRFLSFLAKPRNILTSWSTPLITRQSRLRELAQSQSVASQDEKIHTRVDELTAKSEATFQSLWLRSFGTINQFIGRQTVCEVSQKGWMPWCRKNVQGRLAECASVGCGTLTPRGSSSKFYVHQFFRICCRAPVAV